MKILLTMPQPGETITEGNIIRWIVPEGSPVKESQPIVELETEKAVFEYESPYEGKLVEITAKEGETVPVGNPIAVFEVSSEKAAVYFMLGIGKKTEETVQKTAGGLSPLVRHLLQEYGISVSELDRIRGTGPGGRITKENILQYLESKKGPPKKELAAGKDVETVSLSPIRLRIAEHMVRSKAAIPHAHTGLSIDLTRLVEYRNKSKKIFMEKHGIPLGILALIFPCIKKAIRAYPIVNASLLDEAGVKKLALNKKINLGVAVDTERGLYIPVIRNSQDMDRIAFARSVAEVIDRTRKNKLLPADLTGMTFTFNNYGYYGTTLGIQIILPPQVTTLGMGRIELRPHVTGLKIEIRSIADFVLAFDHRVIDGREAGLFLTSLKESLENFSEEEFLSGN